MLVATHVDSDEELGADRGLSAPGLSQGWLGGLRAH
jgi:hypothetical protein